MSDLKPCPFCKKCAVGSRTAMVHLESGVHFRCLWCMQDTPISEEHLPINLLNKIKAEAFKAGFYESGDGFNGEWCGDKEEVSRLAHEYANKPERGEL